MPPKKKKKTNPQNKQLTSSNTCNKVNSWSGGSLHNNINNGLNSSSNINSISSDGSSNINNCISSSERLFSSAGNVFAKKINRLNQNNLHNILFLRENHKLFDQ